MNSKLESFNINLLPQDFIRMTGPFFNTSLPSNLSHFSEIKSFLDLLTIVQCLHQELQLLLAAFLREEVLVAMELADVVVRHLDFDSIYLFLFHTELLDGFAGLGVKLLLLCLSPVG